MRYASSSIRGRLLFLAAIGAVVAVTLTGVGLSLLFDHYAASRSGHELSNYMSQLAADLVLSENGTIDVTDGPPNPRFSIYGSGLYWQVADEAGHQRIRSPSLGTNTLLHPRDLAPDGSAKLYDGKLPDGQSGLYLARAIVFGEAANVRRLDLLVALDRNEMDALQRGFTLDMAPGLALLAVLFILAARFQVDVGLRPLARLGHHVRAIRSGEATRLPLDGPGEVAPLVEELNSLLDVRESEMERARDRAADLAHGIKTPLTALASDARRLRERGINDIAEDLEELAERMRRTVERELARARMRGPGPGRKETPVRRSLDSLVHTLSKTPDGDRTDFIIETSEDFSLPIHPDDLVDLLGNILENAARAARSTVWIRETRDASRVGILVEDDGDGVDENEIAAITSRGVRFAGSPGGAGLGLSIVAEIVSIYGGRLRFARSQRGGLLVEISFLAHRSQGTTKI